MTTHVKNGECARCDYHYDSAADLQLHLQDFHQLGEARAKQEAADTMKGSSNGNGHSASPAIESPNHHVCPKCATPIECGWKTISDARRKATFLVMQARHLEAKLQGDVVGRKRNVNFTVGEAQDLLRRLGSFNAVADHLGVSRKTVVRALDPDSLAPSVKARTS